MNDFAGTAGLVLLLLVGLVNLTRTGRRARRRSVTPVQPSQRVSKIHVTVRSHADIWRARAKELKDEGDFEGAAKAMAEALASEGRASRRAAARAGLWSFREIAYFLDIHPDTARSYRRNRLLPKPDYEGAGGTYWKPETIRKWAARRSTVRKRIGVEAAATRHRAERRITLALAFVPADHRARYAGEWAAEMHGMSPRQALEFSLNVLRSAPMSGLLLTLKRVFGRSAA